MRLANMTWPHAEEYFKNNDTILLSVGSIECHGKHLPLGTDTLIPEKLLDLIEPLTDVAIAPIIPFGACDSQTDYPGTVSLGLDVLYDVFTKLTQGFKAHGVRRFAVLNGHGGNIPVLDRVALDLQRQGWSDVQTPMGNRQSHWKASISSCECPYYTGEGKKTQGENEKSAFFE